MTQIERDFWQMFKVGEEIVALLPDGKREHGIVSKDKFGRPQLTDPSGHSHHIDGGFPAGTHFETEEDCAYLDWEEEEDELMFEEGGEE